MTPDPHEASAAQFSLRRIPVTVCITLLIVGVYVAQLFKVVPFKNKTLSLSVP